MTQSKFYPLSNHTNIYKLVEQPNSSYQVGKSYVNKPIYYGGFLKNEQLANYAANYLRLEANINVYKVFLEQSKTKQKQTKNKTTPKNQLIKASPQIIQKEVLIILLFQKRKK